MLKPRFRFSASGSLRPMQEGAWRIEAVHGKLRLLSGVRAPEFLRDMVGIGYPD